MKLDWDQWSKLKRDGIIIPLYNANPENCFIDSEAKIGLGTKIWQGVTISDTVTIGTNCEIGKCTTIVGNITIGNNVEIGHHIKISGDGHIGDNCKVNGDIKNPRMKKNCKVLMSA